MNRARIGYAFPASLAKTDKVHQVLKFIDWASFSDEGRFLENFGVEDITCKKDSNGNWTYTDAIMKDNSIAAKEYGLVNNCFGNSSPLLAVDALFAPPESKEFTKYLNDNNLFYPLAPAAKFTVDEMDQKKLIATPLGDYFFKQTSLFCFGKRDVATEWSAFIQECKDRGSDKLTEMYNKTIGK